MKILKTVLLTLSIAVPFASAQSVDEILDKYVQAVGGKAAIEKVTTRVMKGTLENPDEGPSPAEIYAKAPNKYLAVTNIPNYGAVQEAWNGEKGWKKDPDSGLRDMSRDDSANARRDYDFYRELRLKDLFPKMALSGKTKVGDRDAFIVDATSGDGASEKLYFDSQSGLLVRRDFERVTLDDGIILFEVDYEDFKDVQGVKVPFTVIRKTPDYALSYRFSEVTFNVPIDDGKFAKPEK
jgi:hypothetical protein